MFKFKTKSGQDVEVNADSYDAAKALQWVEVKESKPKAKNNGNSAKRSK